MGTIRRKYCNASCRQSAWSSPKNVAIRLNTESFFSKWAEKNPRKCKGCGKTTDLSINHIIPRSVGGTDDLSNLEILCRGCNSRAYAKLVRKAMKAYFANKEDYEIIEDF